MGVPSGTVTHPYDATLEANFSMRALVESAEYAGQADRVVLRAFVGTGPDRLIALLDSGHATATLTAPYTADTEVAVGLEEVDDVFDLANDITADLLHISCQFYPPATSGTDPPPLTFDGLLTLMLAELAPMSAVPYEPPGSDDVDLAQWFVRPDTSHSAVRDGTSLETAWGGYAEIPASWSPISPGDTLWTCGTFDDATLTVGKSGAAGAYIKIRTDHPTDPGFLYGSRVVSAAEWIPAPNGEFYVTGVTTANNMLYEDDKSLYGPNVASLNKARVFTTDPVADTIEVLGERAIVTGTPLWIPRDFAVVRLPDGLQFADALGGPYYAIFVAMAGSRYVVKLALSLADALANVAVDITDPGTGQPWFVFLRETVVPHNDAQWGQLQPGQFDIDPVLQRLYYKPTNGTPADHVVRLSSDKLTVRGVVIYGEGKSFIKVLGGGEYGGLFPERPAPRGRIGLAHLNGTHWIGCSDIIVDGVEILGARSGNVFDNTPRWTVRNAKIGDIGRHASGGENVPTAEPNGLQERNWTVGVGRKAAHGDTQWLVTNPGCHGTINRRNFAQYVGRNSSTINTGVIVTDSSNSVWSYRNWIDISSGEIFEIGSGPDGECNDARVMSNVITRAGVEMNADGVNEVNRQCAVGLFVTDAFGIHDTIIAGNLVANSKFQNSAEAPFGAAAVRMRGANTTEKSDGTIATRNAYFNVQGLVYSVQGVGAGTPAAEFDAQDNLYVSCSDFLAQDLAGTGDDFAYDAAHVLGAEAGFWSFDTGNDTDSQVGTAARIDFNTGPTLDQLRRFLTQDEEFDSYDPPTLEGIGTFPRIPT